MKKEKALIAIGVLVIALLIGWAHHLKAQITYADFDCPMCGSNEVLDYGETEQGRHSQCFDCKAEFYTIDEYGYE